MEHTTHYGHQMPYMAHHQPQQHQYGEPAWMEQRHGYSSQHQSPIHEYGSYGFDSPHTPMDPVFAGAGSAGPPMHPHPHSPPHHDHHQQQHHQQRSSPQQLQPLITAPWPSLVAAQSQYHPSPLPPPHQHQQHQPPHGPSPHSASSAQPPQLPPQPPPLQTSVSVPPQAMTSQTTPHTPAPRRTLTDSDRRKMCQYHEDNPTKKQTEIGEIFGVERSTVSKVLRHKDKYLNPSNQPHNPSPSSPNAATASPRSPHHSLLHSSSGRKVSTSSGGGGSGSGSSKTSSRHHPDIDRTLAKWCSNQQAKGVTLTDELIRDQARLFLAASGAVDVFGSGGGDGGSGGRGGSGSGGGKSGSGSNFSAANSAASAAAYLEGDKWLDKFKLKHNISTPGTPTPDSATRRKASLAASTAHPSDKMDTSVVVDSSPSLQTPLSPRSATTTESTTLPTAGSMEGLGIRNAHPSTSTALDSPGSLFSPSTNAATMTNTSTAGAGSGAYISPPQSAEALSVTTPTSSSSSSRHGGGGGGGGSGGAQSTIFDRSAMPPPPTTSGVPSSTTRSGAPPIHWATGAPPPLSNPYALADPPQTNMSSLFSSDWSGSSHFENSEKRTGSISAQDAQRCLETALAFLEQEVPTPDNGEQGWGRDVTDVRRVMGRLRMGSLQADSGGGFGVGGYAGEEEEVGDEMMGRIDEGGE